MLFAVPGTGNPKVGIMLMGPPLVDIVADEPLGAVIVSGAGVFVLLKTEIAPPNVTTDEVAPKVSDGAMNLKALPPVMVRVTLSAIFIPPEKSVLELFSFLISTSPPGLAPNV